MKTTTRTIPLLLAAALLAAHLTGCAPARTGFTDGTLTTNMKPSVSIHPAANLAPVDSGRLWVSAQTNVITAPALASFDYAVLNDKNAPEAFAYAAIVRLQDATSYDFIPQTGGKLPDAYGSVETVGDPQLSGTRQTMHIAQEGDWASELLRANGKAVPASWLAMRWVYSVDSATRAVAEYREPKPEWLDLQDKDVLPLKSKDTQYLRDFAKRASGMFSVDGTRGAFSSGPASSTLTIPAQEPDIPRIAGPILVIDQGDSDGDYD